VAGAGPIRVLLVDDEPLARRGLRQLLAAHPDAEVVGECGNGRDALAALDTLAPELLLLDVQMPALDGLAVARARGGRRAPAAIFVTAHERFAVPAFAVEALDYLLKPVDETRFAAAMARARRHLRPGPCDGAPAGESNAPASGSHRRAPRLVVPGARGATVLAADEIDWIGAEDYYAAVHALGRRYLLRESLASLAARLDPTRFVRVHRAAVVNVDRVRRLRTAGGETTLVLHDGTRLPVSRRRRAVLDATLAAFAAEPGRR
jgi:two-component system LytT family response regulator